MNNFYEKLKPLINPERLYANTERLLKKELPQTFSAYHAAAREAVAIMKEMGFDKTELLKFPADGKTVYQDKCMPMAWDASIGKLTIRKSPFKFPNPVVADYQVHPFHLVKGSVSTPPGGTELRIITEMQMFGGADPKGCLIICETTTPPRPAILKKALDLGALGIITDFSKGGTEYPDSIQWVNACSEGPQWQVQADDRDFIAFSISRKTGDMLRAAANAGVLTALVESDGRRYEGTLPAAVGTIKGKSQKEIWLFAHLHEPLSDDNSLGVAMVIEIAQALKALAKDGKPEFGIRTVFATEMYGFAAYAEENKRLLEERAIFALNLDGLPCHLGDRIVFHANGNPSFADYFAQISVPMFNKEIGLLAEFYEKGSYFDDMLLGDKNIGLPTLWLIKSNAFVVWHNSVQTMDYIDKKLLFKLAVGLGAFLASASSLNNSGAILRRCTLCAIDNLNSETKELAEKIEKGAVASSDIKFAMAKRLEREKSRFEQLKRAVSGLDIKDALEELCDFSKSRTDFLMGCLNESKKECQKTHGKLLEYAASVIPARKLRGFPYDLKRIPKAERRDLPDGSIYGPFTRIMSNMDGKKNLKELILEAEWEAGADLSHNVAKYLNAVNYLSEYGYFKTRYSALISKKDIISSLKKIGLEKGDTVFLHSGLSQLGVIEGGAATIIFAFLELLGKKGNLFLPAFTRPYIAFEGLVTRDWNYHPYDPCDPSQISVGAIPKAFFAYPGVVRSNHPTHSVLGLGPDAEKYLKRQAENDSPSGEHSVFAFLPELNAKMLWFGADLATSTYLHYIEDEADLPYLKSAAVTIKTKDGFRYLFYPKHLPGCRDFYNKNAEKSSKIYRKMFELGLEMRKTPLGIGEIKALDSAQAYKLARKAVKEDPQIMLCDKAECVFCSRFRKSR